MRHLAFLLALTACTDRAVSHAVARATLPDPTGWWYGTAMQPRSNVWMELRSDSTFVLWTDGDAPLLITGRVLLSPLRWRLGDVSGAAIEFRDFADGYELGAELLERDGELWIRGAFGTDAGSREFAVKRRDW